MKDWKQVLTTRPRVGGTRREKSRRFRSQDRKMMQTERYDGLSERETKRVGWHNNKEFADLLNPLERWLRKQVGRPWDKVWSEICSVADARSVQGRHVRQHIGFAVRLDVHRREDGKIVQNGGYGFVLQKGELFVDPKTGLLMKVRR